jgi:hypothetical protein
LRRGCPGGAERRQDEEDTEERVPDPAHPYQGSAELRCELPRPCLIT